MEEIVGEYSHSNATFAASDTEKCLGLLKRGLKVAVCVK